MRFSVLLLSALASVASASNWPMITVNPQGQLVLNSQAKVKSMVRTASTLAAGPLTGTPENSATAITDDSDLYIVNVPSGMVAKGGYLLPKPTIGREIRFLNTGTNKGAFTIWTGTEGRITDQGVESTSVSIPATTPVVTVTATSDWLWVVTQTGALATTATVTHNAFTAKGYVHVPSSAITSAKTLTATETLGGVLTVTPTSSIDLQMPTAATLTAADSTSADGDSYELVISNTHTPSTTSSTAIVTLTTNTGITVPSDGSQDIYPGMTRTYLIYRTSSTAWSVAIKGTFQGLPSTMVSQNAGTTNQADVTITVNALYMAFVMDPTGGAQSLSITNGYAKLGDRVSWSPITNDAATVKAEAAGAGAGCVVPFAGMIRCYWTSAGNLGSFLVRLHKD